MLSEACIQWHYYSTPVPPLPAISFDPSPLPIAHAPGQEIFDEAYISSDGWKFDVGAQVEQLFDPSASTDGLWDADLIAVNIPSSKCNTVKSMSRWH